MTMHPLSFTVAALALTAALPPQAGIRIVQVPDRLVLPAEPGSNLLLEVTVPGTPSAVFLAADPQRARAGFTDLGDGHWQLNLADPLVTRVLRGASDDALWVFADGDGPRRQSAAILFARAETAPPSLRCEVWLAREATSVPVSAFRHNWFEPEQVERIEIKGPTQDLQLVAHMGNTDCPLVHQEGRRSWTLTLDAEKRAAWLAAGQLQLVAQRGVDVELGFRLDAVPERLDIPDAGVEWSLVQRRHGSVPGSRDYFRVHLGDITGGQALLDLRTADGRVVVPQRSVHSREHVEFGLAGARYVLVVRKLVNLLIGDDFAELVVLPAERYEPDPIAQLLQCIATAEVTFVREGQDYGGDEAARLMRVKLDLGRNEVTVEEFIDRIASRSSTTGNEYEVRLPDGRTLPARQWLHEQLARIRAGKRRDAPGR